MLLLALLVIVGYCAVRGGRDESLPGVKDAAIPASLPSDAEIERAVAQSDDFKLHRASFVTGARRLIAEGKCTVSQLREYGGWVKSTTTFKVEPVYFTYCGRPHVSSRHYLDARTGRVFQQQ
jgi:hypothetical protein